jgi:hypothetical protein
MPPSNATVSGGILLSDVHQGLAKGAYLRKGSLPLRAKMRGVGFTGARTGGTGRGPAFDTIKPLCPQKFTITKVLTHVNNSGYL